MRFIFPHMGRTVTPLHSDQLAIAQFLMDCEEMENQRDPN
jgi:hypothetical protein